MTEKQAPKQQGKQASEVRVPAAGEHEWHESPPVTGKSELFITDESAAQVANVNRPYDADPATEPREVKSEAPREPDPAEKWDGDSSSDP
jgi:hypothetical protein